MASSCNSGSASRESWIRYSNMNCQCRLVSDIKVSQSNRNPGRLYYSCKENKCKWVGWCEPDDGYGKNIVESNEVNKGILEDEVNKLKDLVDGLSEGMQGEFATIKFEFDNCINAVKNDVDSLEDEVNKLKNSGEGLSEGIHEVLTLNKELKETNQKIENMKFVMFGFMFVMVLVFISKNM